MPEKQIQDFLFQRIKQTVPNGRSLVDVVADALHLSQDSAYRRIRGETPLVLEEAQTLCRHFNISLDQLLNISGQSIVFNNIEMDNGVYGFKTYLTGILQRLRQLQNFNEVSIIYLTKDLPLFYQFCCKPLFTFRYFFWMKTIFRHPDFIQRKFSLDSLPADVESLGSEILAAFCKIPSVEIWNSECINSILQQIQYCCVAGFMTKEDACEVHSGLHEMLEHLQVQAEFGRKFLPAENPRSKNDNFQLFYNRVGLGDNTIMVLHDNNKTLYLDYNVLNYLTTTDENFCNHAHKNLKNIMRRSTLISSGSEKQRNIFFNILHAKLPLNKNKEKQLS